MVCYYIGVQVWRYASIWETFLTIFTYILRAKSAATSGCLYILSLACFSYFNSINTYLFWFCGSRMGCTILCMIAQVRRHLVAEFARSTPTFTQFRSRMSAQSQRPTEYMHFQRPLQTNWYLKCNRSFICSYPYLFLCKFKGGEVLGSWTGLFHQWTQLHVYLDSG